MHQKRNCTSPTLKKNLDSNPIREIEKPKNKCYKKVGFLKPEEIRGLIDATDGQK